MMDDYVYGPSASGWATYRIFRSPNGRIIKRKQLKTFSGADAKMKAETHRNKLENKYENKRRKERSNNSDS